MALSPICVLDEFSAAPLTCVSISKPLPRDGVVLALDAAHDRDADVVGGPRRRGDRRRWRRRSGRTNDRLAVRPLAEILLGHTLVELRIVVARPTQDERQLADIGREQDFLRLLGGDLDGYCLGDGRLLLA